MNAMEHNSEEKTNIKRIACRACREIKVKCDRKDPCSRCFTKQIDCVYATRRKPGPAEGRGDELRQLIKKLRTEIGEQKDRNETLEKTFQTMTRSMEHKDMRLGGHMANMNTLNTYIAVYFDKGFAFLQVQPPFQNLNDYYNKHDMRNPLMNSIFGVGALISGNQAHANMFISEIESTMQSAFDDVNPYICAMSFVLAGFYASSGDEARDSAYNNRALVMAKILKKKTRTEKGFDINIIQKYSTIKQALFTGDLNTLEAIVHELCYGNYDDGYCAFAVAHLENSVLLWSAQAVQTLDLTFVMPNNIHKMFTLLSFADRLVLKLPSPMQQLLLMRLCAAKVLVYMLTLQDDVAHEVAQQMLAIISNPVEILIDHPYFTLAPLLIAGQYYMQFGVFTNEFQQMLAMTRKVDTVGIVESLLLTTKNNNTVGNMVSWCYFYPQLTVYREKSAEMLQSLYASTHREEFVKPYLAPRVVEYDDSLNTYHEVYPALELHDTAQSNFDGLNLELNVDSVLLAADDSKKHNTTGM